MAIDKAVENEFGVQFTYHKLRDVRVINDDNTGVQLILTIQSWLDKQARIDGKQPTVRQCIISNADFAMTPFYALLKAKFTDFAQGADDMDNGFKAAKLNAAKDAPEVQKKDPIYTVQTAQGALMKRWKEQAADVEAKEIKEAAEEPAEKTEIKEKESKDDSNTSTSKR